MKELLIAVTVLGACGAVTPPQWPSAYSVRGIISIPYAELKEPFFAYYDGSVGSSRIDYYGDTVKTYQISSLGQYGSMMKLVPVTTEAQSNIITCLQQNGTLDQKVTPQSVLPSLHGYTYAGSDVVDGIETEKWTFSSKIGAVTSKYAMWIKYEKTSKVSGKEMKEPIPVRFEMKGYNLLLGSHYDHYYLTYDLYSTDTPAPSVWQIDPNITCSSYLSLSSTLTFNPIREFIHSNDEHIENAWVEFKKSHNKKYKDHEHHKRRQIFRDNFRFISSTNRAGLGFQLKVNHFADQTPEEIRSLRGRRFSKSDNGASRYPYSNKDVLREVDSTPESFSWRLLGGVTPVKDQSICGSCWSFGTTGAVEGAYFVKTGQLISLSEQALVDCSWGFGNNGCDGGEDFRSYQWIMKHGGIPLEGEYGQYLGNDGYCHIDQVKLVAPITGYVNVTPHDENALKVAIFKKGPISVAIDASKKSFTFYSHGVYSDPNCKSKLEELDHAVLAVGYGILNGKKYWLIKNSWSNLWGNDGYILIASDNNICGVMTTPTYVTM